MPITLYSEFLSLKATFCRFGLNILSCFCFRGICVVFVVVLSQLFWGSHTLNLSV